MQTIALIGSDMKAEYIAQHAKKMSIRTICFAWEKGAITDDAVDCFYPISIFEKDKILEICIKEQINGVMPTTELTIPIAAFIAHSMGLNGNDPEIMNNITSKNWVRSKLTDTKYIKQPIYQYITSPAQINNMADIIFPVVVKPAAEGGKRGINVVNNKKELAFALETAFSVDKRGHGVIVEQYLDHGMECSVEGLSYHGWHQIIQVTQNICSGPPHCVELGHSQPANIPIETRNLIISAVIELLDKTNFKNGATCTEVKIIDGKVYLIELNSRFGGDGIAYPLTILSTGYDYISETIKASMDIKPQRRDENTHVRYSGLRFVTEQTEYLRQVFDKCDNKEWLYEKNYIGDDLHELTHNDMAHVNYFIYSSNERLVFEGEEIYENF